MGLDRSFRVFAPLSFFEKADAAAGEKRRIAGVISTETKDKQDEVVLQRGLDFNPFLKSGWFNDNHSKKTTDVLGYPDYVRQFSKGEKLPDGEHAPANCTWAEGYLLDTPDAKKVWDLGKALQKSPRRLGFSIEGKVKQRAGSDGKIVAKAEVSNVAVTNCFPGDVRVVGVPKRVTRRTYSGPMVEIVLSTGEKLTGTPNHPVLTQRGWVGLGSLREGHDRIGRFCGDVVPSASVTHDVQNVPPTFDEVFHLAALAGIEARAPREGDFHGDTTAQGNIDVVLPDGFLKGRLQAAFEQKFGKHALTATDKGERPFAPRRTLLVFVKAGLRTASGFVRALCEAPSLFLRALPILSPVLVGEGPNNACLRSDAVDGPAVDPEQPRDLTSGLPRSVGFSDLLSKRTFNFSGHVHNLETAHGWYEANGVVAHNCPVGEGTRLEALAKSLRNTEEGVEDEDLDKALAMGAGTPGVNPSAQGPTTGEGAGNILTPKHMEEDEKEDLRKPAPPKPAPDAPVAKSLALAAIQNRLGCNRDTAEQAYRLLLNLKQRGLLGEAR